MAARQSARPPPRPAEPGPGPQADRAPGARPVAQAGGAAGAPDRPPSVLVIDENRARAAIIEAGLREAGHTEVTVIDSMAGLARRVEALAPDVIVIDLGNPDRDVLEDMFSLSRAARRPVAMFVDRSDRESIAAAVDAGVSAYVVGGLSRERVKPILDMAISRFEAFARLSRELEAARDELAERRVVDRAKALLMRSRGLPEAEAYALLRRAAMDRGRKIAEVAEGLLAAADLLGGPPGPGGGPKAGPP